MAKLRYIYIYVYINFDIYGVNTKGWKRYLWKYKRASE